ncbi:hydrolase [Liquorilactobacillus sucicola DSM 21376 = JCM 15457]|uniref:HAD superfamily hydrolase n=1 Tax=Liquorilactobacillus sucicola DSM 21376 = JCM 15457 TaxID=1423806 RepID=A0A023CX44_9LACO|nr:HAD family phosphatase [Liquorilactobacillus sucicola]KRN06168.1 HAD superfamily hydrolase [Liquorilactobacillus sucicola DSM 21376 = JCM 15457]GAJ26095.1 hydrolase [Liquorilactobacillus sucicola DSM 21376 = JCM 15457]
MNLDLVIFDMDGLVVDSEKVYFKANMLAAEALKMPYSFEYYRQYIGAGTEEMLNKMSNDYGSQKLVDEFIRLSRENVYELVEKDGLPLKKGFMELSEYLHDSHINKALASSNDKRAIDYFLEKAHLQKQFDYIVSTDDVAHAKPAPDIFNKAWSVADEPDKKKTLVLEDSINGINAAISANIPAIMIPDLIEPPEQFRQKPLAILDDLAAVRSFIQ